VRERKEGRKERKREGRREGKRKEEGRKTNPTISFKVIPPVM
jgi:hypothetical protein